MQVRSFFLSLFILFSTLVHCEEIVFYPSPNQSEELNLDTQGPLLAVVIMVKDEGTVIKDTLMPFVKGGVKAFLVYDTGSTDDTMKQAQELFDECGLEQGFVAQQPFVDFATSRNQALDLAEKLFPQATFMIMPDAEWYMHDVEGLLRFCEQEKNNLWHRCYLVRLLGTGLDFYQQRLIRCRAFARFEGVVHEYVNAPAYVKAPASCYFELRVCAKGAEKTQRRWLRDIKLLEAEFEKNSADPRTVFYLAQTYHCLGDLDNAYKYYALRATMLGWVEENFMAQYRLAQVAERMADEGSLPWGVVLDHYLEAYVMKPNRVEPLIRLAAHYINQEKHCLSYLFGQRACELPYPYDDTLFVDKNLYDFDRYDIIGRSAWYVGEFDKGERALINAISKNPTLEHLFKNLKFYLDRKEQKA